MLLTQHYVIQIFKIMPHFGICVVIVADQAYNIKHVRVLTDSKYTDMILTISIVEYIVVTLLLPLVHELVGPSRCPKTAKITQSMGRKMRKLKTDGDKILEASLLVIV